MPKQYVLKTADIYNTHVAFVCSFVLQFDCSTVIESTFSWKVLQAQGKNMQRRIHNPTKHLRWSFLPK